MEIQSKWIVNDEAKNQITRACTLKPRLDYAGKILDGILDIFVQKRFELNKSNINQCSKTKGLHILSDLQEQIHCELELLWAVESLRQVRRCLDSVSGLDNIALVLAPTISIVRTVRSKTMFSFPEADSSFGELSLLLGGLIIDAGHLSGTNLNFELANQESCRLLDEAKLIANSKIYKQFPNVEML